MSEKDDLIVNRQLNLLFDRGVEPTDDGVALYSEEHTGEMKEMMSDDRTIGEIMLAKKKPSLLFRLLDLVRNK